MLLALHQVGLTNKDKTRRAETFVQREALICHLYSETRKLSPMLRGAGRLLLPAFLQPLSLLRIMGMDISDWLQGQDDTTTHREAGFITSLPSIWEEVVWMTRTSGARPVEQDYLRIIFSSSQTALV